MDLSKSEWYLRLLEGMTAAQSQVIGGVNAGGLFEGLLSALLELCDSEYGFIGETYHDSDGEIYLKTHAITNIAWNEQTRRYYEENAPQGLEFKNLKTLFGTVMTSEKPVIANNPQTDPRRGGLPLGHPPLDSFLGLPLHSAGKLIGMAGVANRSGGYHPQLVEDLAPFLLTCANAVSVLRTDRERSLFEEQLSDERNRLRAILDGAYEAIITIDEKGIIESCNRRAEEMFGHAESDLVGRNVSMLMPSPYHQEHDSYIQRYCKTNEPQVIGSGRDVLGRHKDGKDFPIHLTVTEVHVGKQRLFTGLIRDLSERDEAERHLKQLQQELARNRFGQLIGRSEPMRRLYKHIGDVAQSDWTVLVEGETGTGKELVARAIHAASSRRNGPFVAVNCAGLSDSLLGSQLFGHRRGAFTGAIKDQQGFFQAAEGGTLFLDEIGEVSEDVQTSLLRAIDSNEIMAIGDTVTQKVDIRIITATNRNLAEAVKKGNFRDDLLYRLRVGRIMVPPLRDRGEDVSLLAEAFLAETRIATGKAITSLSPNTLDCLSNYSWPGNVRELRSAIQYAAIQCRIGYIDEFDLPPEISRSSPPAKTEKLQAADLQSEVRSALEQAQGNRTMAAKILGVSRATLYRRLKEIGIEDK